MPNLDKFLKVMNGDLIEHIEPQLTEADIISRESYICNNTVDINDSFNELNLYIDTFNDISNKLLEIDSLIYILRTDGISPIALKLLSTNKLLIDTWKVTLPSTESLSTNNQVLANNLADQLQIKLDIADAAIEGLWDKIKKAGASIINKIIKSNDVSTKQEEANDKVLQQSKKIDQVKPKNKYTFKFLPQESLNKLSTYIKNSSGKYEELTKAIYEFQKANGDITKALVFYIDKNTKQKKAELKDVDNFKQSNRGISDINDISKGIKHTENLFKSNIGPVLEQLGYKVLVKNTSQGLVFSTKDVSGPDLSIKPFVNGSLDTSKVEGYKKYLQSLAGMASKDSGIFLNSLKRMNNLMNMFNTEMNKSIAYLEELKTSGIDYDYNRTRGTQFKVGPERAIMIYKSNLRLYSIVRRVFRDQVKARSIVALALKNFLNGKAS